MTLINILISLIFALFIGLLMGIIGGGGGGIYVAVLILYFHQDAKTAAMTALVLSTLTLSGAFFQYLRKKQFVLDYFIWLSLLDIAGTVIGNLIMNSLNENTVKIIIFCVLLVSGLSTLFKVKSIPIEKAQIKSLSRSPLTIPIGLTSGLITGTTGLSASTMLSSLLIGVNDFPPYLAIGTTTLVSFVGNLVSIFLLLAGGVVAQKTIFQIDYHILIIFGLGSAVGALIGAFFTTKFNRKILAIILAVMAIVPGIYLLIK